MLTVPMIKYWKFGPIHIKTSLLVLIIFFILTGASCKKKKAFNQENAEVSAQLRMAEGETDEVLKDVNTMIMENPPLRGRSSGAANSLCGVTLDTSQRAQGLVVLNYNGTDCYGRIRSGIVRVVIENYPASRWKHQGARLTISFLNYRMLRSSDNRSVIINGEQTIYNTSGHSWFDMWFMNQQSLLYRHQASKNEITVDGHLMIVSFDRELTYTYRDNVTTCRINGLATETGKAQVSAWGISGDGNNFTASVKDQIVWSTACGAIAPVSGLLSIQEEGKEFSLECIYGTNSEGTRSTENCPFGFIVEWSRKKRTNSRVFGYY